MGEGETQDTEGRKAREKRSSQGEESNVCNVREGMIRR